MKKTRFISLVLALIMIAGMLSACNKTTDPEAEERVLDHVYKSTEISFENAENIYNVSLAGDKLLYITDEYDEEAGSSTTTLMSMDMDGTNPKEVYKLNNANDEEGVYRYSYMNNFGSDKQGNIYIVLENSFESYENEFEYVYETNTSILIVDNSGNVLKELDMKEALKLPEDQHVYIYNIAFDGSGRFIFQMDQKIYVFNLESESVEFALETNPEGWVASMFAIEGEGFAVVESVHTYNETTRTSTQTQTMRRIDIVGKKWGQETALDCGTNFNNICIGDGDYLLYYSDYNAGVFGLKHDGTSEKIIDWINSDINSNYLGQIYYYGDNKFLVTGYNYNTGKNTIMILEEKPESEIQPTKVLTYATTYLSYNIKDQVIDFNKNNGEYRVEILDYNAYSDTGENVGYEQLNMDIIAGRVPDIIDLEGLNAQSYISKGILTDIYALMEASETSSKDDYDERILRLMETDGKLYTLSPSYTIMSVVGKSSIVGSEPGWTIDDLNALLASMPEGTKSFDDITRNDVLYYSYILAMEQFIDWENGKSNFGENFVKLLEFANTFPEELDYEMWDDPSFNWDQYSKRYAENKVLLQVAWIDGPRSVRNYMENTFEEDVTFIGFPTAEKVGTAISTYGSFGIAEQSSSKDAAWEFLKSLILSAEDMDFSDSGGYYYAQLSIDKSYMNKAIEYELTPLKEREGYVEYSEEGIVYGATDSIRPVSSVTVTTAQPEENTDAAEPDSTDPDSTEPDYTEDTDVTEDEEYAEDDTNDDIDIDIGIDMPSIPGEEWNREDYESNYHLTQAEVDKFNSLLESVSGITNVDSTVVSIIEEEAAEYFAGRRSAQDTAANIQSRVQIYVDESK